MEKILLITGNGFDLAHKLPTSYSKFKDWLIEIQRNLIIDKITEKNRIEELCEIIKLLEIDINVSKGELRKAICDNNINGLKCNVYKRFLGELFSKTYSEEFLEEKGYPLEVFDNEKIQEVINVVEKIIDELTKVTDDYKKCKDICVLDTQSFDEMDEIDKIEYILETFEQIEYFMKQMGKDVWGCFEESCGKIDFEYLLNQIDNDLFKDKEGDLDEWLRDDLLQQIINPYVEVLSSLSNYFKDWVNTIKIDEVELNEDFEKFFKEYDVNCLSFNYTDTIEKVYGYNNVFHIHGKQNEDIFVGHGNNEIFEDESNIALEDAMYNIHVALKKDTKKIYNDNKETYFDKIDESIKKVFVYGFSFGDVDDPYLIAIKEKIPEAEWYVQAYFSEDFPRYKEKLKSVGVEDDKIHHWYSV